MNTVIVGIGNPTRGDDGIGHAVVDALPPLPVRIAKIHGEATEIMDFFNAQKVILVDAMVGGDEVVLIDAISTKTPHDLSNASTHAFGLSQAVELARALGDLPGELWIIAVPGLNFEHGDDLSEFAKNKIDSAVKLTLKTLGNFHA